MKIVQVNTFDVKGGAARAAYRLHKGLRNIGVDCRTISKRKSSADENVIEAQGADAEERFNEIFYLSAIQRYYIDAHRTGISNTIFSLPYPGIDISGLSEVKEADVINLHWVAWYQSAVTLKKLFSLGKSIIWTLHDQWPFTGGCHYSAGCTKYRKDCSRCPQLGDDPFDLAAMVLKDKLDFFKGADLTIVTPSKWLASCAKESTLFKGLRVEVIPNSLETDVLVPQPKAEAKQKIGVSPDDITILFGAEHGIEKRKGFHELVAAIHHCMTDAAFRAMAERGTLKILCFGNASKELESIGLPVISLGYLNEDEKIREAYCAADFFVLPSLEDNLPNTMLESLSCATPVVAFDTGGISDIIIAGETGMLAPTGDIVALGRAIVAMISDPVLRNRMGETGRKRMVEGYSLGVQARRYLAFYEELLARKSPGLSGKREALSPEEQIPVYPTLDTTLGANFESIYDGAEVKSLREAGPDLQKQLTQCSQIKADREGQIRQISSVLNERNDQLRQAQERLKERDAKIEEMQGAVTQKNDLLKQRDEMISQKNDLLRQKDEQLASQTDLATKLREQAARDRETILGLEKRVKDHEEQFRQKCEELIEIDNKFKLKCVEVVSKDETLVRLCEEKSGELQRFEKELRRRDEHIADLLNSMSWKITSPLRAVYGILLRKKKK